PLPLCETVARFSAAELQNHRIEVDGFYGVPLHAAAPRAALARAHLAVYQGHAGDDTLFYEPEEYEEEGSEDHEGPGYQPMEPPHAEPEEEPGGEQGPQEQEPQEQEPQDPQPQ
ncbi:MAG TPA: hypothetical protein DEA08_02720, partial [Planctomycetes bacterium]|nr:hypothetical protein [Planctomycetota bacterium]